MHRFSDLRVNVLPGVRRLRLPFCKATGCIEAFVIALFRGLL